MAEPSAVQREELCAVLSGALEPVRGQPCALEPVRRERLRVADLADPGESCASPERRLVESLRIDLGRTVLKDVGVKTGGSRIALDEQTPLPRIFTPADQVLTDAAIPAADGLPRILVTRVSEQGEPQLSLRTGVGHGQSTPPGVGDQAVRARVTAAPGRPDFARQEVQIDHPLTRWAPLRDRLKVRL